MRAGLLWGAALDFVAAFFVDVLREHPDVSEHGNTFRRELGNNGSHRFAAFQFHGVRTGFEKLPRVCESCAGEVI